MFKLALVFIAKHNLHNILYFIYLYLFFYFIYLNLYLYKYTLYISFFFLIYVLFLYRFFATFLGVVDDTIPLFMGGPRKPIRIDYHTLTNGVNTRTRRSVIEH